MITELNKKEIYELLKRKLDFNKPYPLSAVGKELTIAGHGCRRYGYARMKNLMKELKEFIKIEDYEHEGHSNSNITLIPWTPGQTDGNINSLWTSTSSEMAEIENEMGSGLIKIKKAPAKQDKHALKLSKKDPGSYEKQYSRLKTKESEAAGQSGNTQRLNDKEKEKIYQILCGVFPKNQKIHMAKVSKYLIERGFSPKNYGYSKMKNLLQEMPQFIAMDEIVMHGVPNVQVTLLDRSSLPEKKALPVQVKPKVPAVIAQPAPEKPKLDLPVIEAPRKEKQVDFLSLTYLPPKILDFLKRKGIGNPEKLLAQAYQQSLEQNTVQARSYSITFPVFFLPEEGSIAVLKKNEKPYGRQWYLSYVGSPRKEQEAEEEEREEEHPIPPGKSLEQFADLGYWQDFLKELAEMALPEKWDDSNKRYGRYYILKKYMQYTFYRLLQENKVCISEDHKFAAFNTGLVNNRYDDIYACFVPNPQKGKEPWKFEAFAIAGIRGKDGYGKMLTNYFNPLPQVPAYVEKNEDLIYDLSKDLITDYEHIIIDNMHRLPLGYLREGCYGDEEALAMIADIEVRGKSREGRK